MKKMTVFAMIIFLTMFLVVTGCSRGDREDVEVSLDEPQAVEEVPEIASEDPAPIEEAPVEPEALVEPAPSDETVPPAVEATPEPTAQPASAPIIRTAGAGNAEILNQRTKRGRVLERSFEETSLFSNINCGEDRISFTFKNMDDHDFYLTKVKFEEQDEKEALGLRVNNKDVRANPVEACGTETIKAQEEITCNVKALVRRGVSHWGRELVNELEANSLFYNSKVVFKCPGGEEVEQAPAPAEEAPEAP